VGCKTGWSRARVSCSDRRTDTFDALLYNWSEFFELLEMMVWFLANCYWVSGNRAAAKWVFDTSADGRKERAKEDEWGFGQIVPLFLLSELEDRVH
jgi:hypothetical protein